MNGTLFFKEEIGIDDFDKDGQEIFYLKGDIDITPFGVYLTEVEGRKSFYPMHVVRFADFEVTK